MEKRVMKQNYKKGDMLGKRVADLKNISMVW